MQVWNTLFSFFLLNAVETKAWLIRVFRVTCIPLTKFEKKVVKCYVNGRCFCECLLCPLKRKNLITLLYPWKESIPLETLTSSSWWLLIHQACWLPPTKYGPEWVKGAKHPLCTICKCDNSYDVPLVRAAPFIGKRTDEGGDCYAEAVLAALFVISQGHVVCQQVMIYRLLICRLIYLGKHKMFCGFHDVTTFMEMKNKTSDVE